MAYISFLSFTFYKLVQLEDFHILLFEVLESSNDLDTYPDSYKAFKPKKSKASFFHP